MFPKLGEQREKKRGPRKGQPEVIDAPIHFCRGCGKPLPLGRSQFHRECLTADKARRVRERRERQEVLFATRLARLRCPHCGEQYVAAKQTSNVSQELACEASQPSSNATTSPQ